MAERIKCSNCKTYYISEMPFAHFRPGGTLCPDCRRNKQLSESLSKTSNKSDNSVSRRDDDDDDDLEFKMEEARLEHERDLEESRQEHELKLASIQSTNNAIERINDIDFGGSNPTIESISKDIDLCLTIASTSLAESFPDTSSTDKREKFNQSEKVANASLKKAELGLNKLRLSEPSDKALKFYTVYKEQLRESKVKQIRRSYDVQIREAKPETWIWFACFFFLPAIIYPAYKTYTAMVVLPKKRDAEIAQLQ